MSNINISVDCVVFGYDSDLDLKVLLITRKESSNSIDTGRDHISLPGDLIKFDEELDPAATRILKNLTSIDKIYLKQFAIFSDPNRVKHPKDQTWLRTYRAHPDERVITIGYISLVNIPDFKPDATYFVDEVVGESTRGGYYEKCWTSINEIPQLAFDHNQIVDTALGFLKKELNHQISSILLPKNFTLPQLQKLHEDILDKKIDKRNFRKQILKEGVIVKTDNTTKTGKKGKPANFYQFNEDNNS
jgi:8-oxo-dGTP diphosphatase